MKRLGGFVNRHMAIAITLLLIFGLSFLPQEKVYSAEHSYTAEPTQVWEYSNNPGDDYDYPVYMVESDGFIYTLSKYYDAYTGIDYAVIEKINSTTGELDETFGEGGIISYDYSSEVYITSLSNFYVFNGNVYILINRRSLEHYGSEGWEVVKLNNISGEVSWSFVHDRPGIDGVGESVATYNNGNFLSTDAGMYIFSNDGNTGESGFQRYLSLTLLGYDGVAVSTTNMLYDDLSDRVFTNVSFDGTYFYLAAMLNPDVESDYNYQFTKIAESDLSVEWVTTIDGTVYGFGSNWPKIAVTQDAIYFSTAFDSAYRVGKLDLANGSLLWGGDFATVGTSDFFDDGYWVFADQNNVYFYGTTATACGEETCYGYFVEAIDPDTADVAVIEEYFNTVEGVTSDMYVENALAFEEGYYIASEYSVTSGVGSDYAWKLQRYEFEESTPPPVEDETNPPIFANLHDLTQPITLTEGQEIISNPYEIRVRPMDDTAVSAVRFYVDSVLTSTDTSADMNGEYSFSWTEEEGESQISVVACDTYDNCSSIIRNVFYLLPGLPVYDYVRPIFSSFDGAFDRINIEDGQTIITDPFQIIVLPLDNSTDGIERVEFYVEDVLIGTDYAADENGQYSWPWNTSNNDGTEVDIRVLAYDISGNVSAPLTVSATVSLTEIVEGKDLVSVVNTDADFGVSNSGLLGWIVDGLVSSKNPIIMGLYETAMAMPPAVAYSFPYIIFILLLIVAYLAKKQLGSEIDSTAKLIEILKLEKTLYEEKSNFLMLSSHYLRTPMTLINGGIEFLVSKNKELAGKLSVIAKALGEKIESSLGKIEKNDIISAIEMPNVEEEKKRRYRSVYVIVPIVIIALVIIAADLIFASIGKIDTNAINFIIQILVFIIASQLVIYFYRLLFNEKKNNLKYRLTIDHERAIDEARSGFIQEMNAELGAELTKIEKLTKNKTDKDFDSIHEGEKRLDYVLGKLELLSEIKNNGYKPDKNNIDADKVLSVILADFAKDAKAKNITISRKDSDVSVVTDRKKLEYVLAALADNAIKFGKEGGEVTLKTEKKDGDVLFIVKDNGAGISEEGMALLFKPFSRTDSALNFDHEGLGLSLYLSNMIANFLGGEIFVESKPKKGTTVTIRVKNRKTM